MTEKELNKVIAANIVRLLDQKNRTQQELAEYVGVSQAAVSSWCSGSKTPRMNKIDKICEFLDVNRSAILGTGTIIKATPDQISNRFRRAVRFSGAEFHFRFHDLRHYYVSIAHALGIPDAYIMEMGGWRTDRTMKRVYRSTLADRARTERDKLTAHFDEQYHVS